MSRWILMVLVPTLGLAAPPPTEPAPPLSAVASGEPTGTSLEGTAATNPVPRDPFWPVGYVPKPRVPETARVPPSAPPTAAKRPPPEWPALKVTGIMQTARGPLAVVEGVGLVEEGSVVRRQIGGYVYRWRVDRITPERLVYTRLDVQPLGGL